MELLKFKSCLDFWGGKSKVFSWLEYANARVHDTTKQKPIELFREEKALLKPFLVV